ncbi:DUF3179 domain-containing protein [Haloarchaeobius amylolyticus]|uniref:DUF3179 domain-containing protein n=1 Tax=Haloarchaeobius amylolyticus TaxID=1198296 RepID=UPI00226FC71C|nr:DUF3179 domain-containing protein [Haloarchaeobius amylolyticus]
MNVRQVLPPDAIPSVDDPEFRPASEYDGDPDDEVVVVDGDTPRAYPIRYLHYHEIVNTDRDGDPIAVTWCPLCGSAVVYDRVVDGQRLTFGVSGKLADDDLVMYDRETESEWKQSLGTAIAGEYEGTDLTVLPAAMVPVRRFRESHPDGEVLARPGGETEAGQKGGEAAEPEYDADPYDHYFEMDGFGLGAHRGTGGREWDRDDDIDPKTVVLGVEDGDDALGFPLHRIEESGGVAQATVGETDAVVFVTPEGIHAFADPGYAFEPADDGAFAADGTTWDGATGESDDGRSLDRLPARRLFAFAWQDDHGPDSFYQPQQ